MTSPAPVSSRDLIAEYRFLGNVLDSSGGDRHGDAHAISYGEDRFGNASSAALFNGVDSFIEIAPPPAIDANSFSIAVWVRFDAMPDDVWSNCVVSQDNGDDENPEQRIFQLSCNWRHIVWHLMTDDRDPIYRSRVRLNEYYHVVATCDGGVHSLYIDGVFQDRIQRTVPEASLQPLHIGRKGTDEQLFYLHGAIDSLRIFNCALGQQEISALFTDGGYTKQLPRIGPASGDAANGKWGRSDVVFLDLESSNLSNADDDLIHIDGRVMDGRPGKWADIDDGEFNRRTGLLTLKGIGSGPNDDARAPFHIVGTLDDGELTVSYNFDGSSGNLIFARF